MPNIIEDEAARLHPTGTDSETIRTFTDQQITLLLHSVYMKGADRPITAIELEAAADMLAMSLEHKTLRQLDANTRYTYLDAAHRMFDAARQKATES